VQMPRYQLAITIGTEAYDDLGAVDLDCSETARREACEVAWELWQDPPFGSKGPVTVRVLNSAGRLVHVVNFPDPYATTH
jgi:hypothetical protein